MARINAADCGKAPFRLMIALTNGVGPPEEAIVNGPATHRLRVEGVNLGNIVEDVEDLSTIRGGGLLLLSVPKRVEAVAARESIGFVAVSKGASSGLFDLNCDESDAKRFRNALIDDFHRDSALRHATIVIDVIPATDDFTRDHESLRAMNRWQQMTAPSLAMPSPAKNEVCEFDLIRPSNTIEVISGPEEPESVTKRASASVAARRQHGKKQKQRFYIDELQRDGRAVKDAAKRVAEAGFVHDLTELTDQDRSKKNLETKMAVIYFDGNKFGELQNTHCRDAEAQSRFDKTLRDYRTDALDQLLTSMDGDPDWMFPGKTAGGRYRLETLLWGGDELIWVLPAWQGWRVVQLFYTASAKWKFENKPLTHAGGIVFCHHKANIHRITSWQRSWPTSQRVRAAPTATCSPIRSSSRSISSAATSMNSGRCVYRLAPIQADSSSAAIRWQPSATPSLT
jgi:hypothetical protein